MRVALAEAVGFDSRLTAWSGPALTLHWSVIHSRPFKSHHKESHPCGWLWRKRWDSNPRTHLWITRFRVEAVMTTSIRFHSPFIIKQNGAKSQEGRQAMGDLTFPVSVLAGVDSGWRVHRGSKPPSPVSPARGRLVSRKSIPHSEGFSLAIPWEWRRRAKGERRFNMEAARFAKGMPPGIRPASPAARSRRWRGPSRAGSRPPSRCSCGRCRSWGWTRSRD